MGNLENRVGQSKPISKTDEETITVRKWLRSFWDYFLNTFRKSPFQKEFKGLQAALSVRTLIAHISIHGSRIIYAILGTNFWQKCYDGLDQRTDLNLPFVNATKPYVLYTMFALLPIGVILNILAWRWRHLTKWIFYFELLVLMVQGFCPFKYGQFR